MEPTCPRGDRRVGVADARGVDLERECVESDRLSELDLSRCRLGTGISRVVAFKWVESESSRGQLGAGTSRVER